MAMTRHRDRHLLSLAVICFLIGVTLLLFIGCAPSKLGKALNVGIGVSTAADYASTRAVQRQGGVEVNPILGQGAVRQALLKGGLAAVTILWAEALERRGGAVSAHVGRAIVMAIYSAATWHNARVLEAR